MAGSRRPRLRSRPRWHPFRWLGKNMPKYSHLRSSITLRQLHVARSQLVHLSAFVRSSPTRQSGPTFGNSRRLFSLGATRRRLRVAPILRVHLFLARSALYHRLSTSLPRLSRPQQTWCRPQPGLRTRCQRLLHGLPLMFRRLLSRHARLCRAAAELWTHRWITTRPI